MTTILISKQYNMVVTDSRGTYTDGSGHTDTMCKRWEVDIFSYAVGSGSVEEIDTFVRKLKKGKTKRLKYSIVAIISKLTGDVTIYEPNPIEVGPFKFYWKNKVEDMEEKNLAFGSGAYHLWGALAANMDIPEAFQHAFLQDSASGGELKVYKLREFISEGELT
jgi:hypothetical protein